MINIFDEKIISCDNPRILLVYERFTELRWWGWGWRRDGDGDGDVDGDVDGDGDGMGWGLDMKKVLLQKLKEIPLVCVILKKFLKVKKKNSPITFNQRITELEITL